MTTIVIRSANGDILHELEPHFTVDLRWSGTSWTCLIRACLDGADLRHTNLRGANLEGATLDFILPPDGEANS